MENVTVPTPSQPPTSPKSPTRPIPTLDLNAPLKIESATPEELVKDKYGERLFFFGLIFSIIIVVVVVILFVFAS